MSNNQEPDPCESLVALVNAAQIALDAAQAALLLCRACNRPTSEKASESTSQVSATES